VADADEDRALDALALAWGDAYDIYVVDGLLPGRKAAEATGSSRRVSILSPYRGSVPIGPARLADSMRTFLLVSGGRGIRTHEDASTP